MRRRVASFFVALLFTICFIISGRTYASDIWTVDGNVDPWSDLEGFSSSEAVLEDSGEDESIFDGLPPDEYFGFTAVTSDGVIEDGVNYDFQTFASMDSFNVTCLGSGYLQIQYASLTTLLSRFNMESLFRSSFPVDSSSTLVSSEMINNILKFSSTSSSYQLFLEFSDLSGLSVDSVTLSGDIRCYLMAYVTREISSNLRASKNFSASSCQLVYFTEDKDTPSIVTAFDVSSNGTVSFSDSPIVIGKQVDRIGLRFIISDIVNTNLGTTSDLNYYGGYGHWSLNLGKLTGIFDATKTEGEITNGLLSGLIEIVTGIYNSVISLPSHFEQVISNIGNILTSITELPGKLWTLISDGLQALFIPTEEQMQDVSDKYDGLLEGKLGFVYQLFSFVVDTFGKLQSALAAPDNYSFHFPGVSFPMSGEMMVIIAEQDVSFDNAVMDVLRPVLGTIITMVSVLAVVSLGFEMVVAILSGKSYSQFIGETREDLDI